MYQFGTKIYVFGGWNNEYQFDNIFHFDVETKEWYEPDVYGQTIPTWNHSAVLVQAIPSAKYFVFGGESANFPEGGPRGFGDYMNTVRYLDTETRTWFTVTTEDEGQKTQIKPKAREYSSISYDTRNSRLIVFGGWANEWLNDIYTLNVSTIVGPPYAISEIIPKLGQLSGGTHVVIRGIGFKETSAINIRFTCGKSYTEVQGEFKSETEIMAVTRSFEEYGPKEVDVRLSMGSGDFTTSAVQFTYFMNTRAHKSLAFGPGLIDGCACNTPAQFIIQARNDHDENRSSGNDKWIVTIKTKGDVPKTIDNIEVVDNDDGSYLVTYQVDEPCKAVIDIQLFSDGMEIPLRGNPYQVQLEENTTKNWNKLNGGLVEKMVKHQLEHMKQWMDEKTEGCSITQEKDVENNVKNLIVMKDHVDEVVTKNERTILDLDQLDEQLKKLQKDGGSKDSQLKQVKKLFDNYSHLKKVAKETKKNIEPFVENETGKNQNVIKRHEDAIKTYFQDMKKKEYYNYTTGPSEAFTLIRNGFEDVKAYEEKNENLGFNAKKFGDES
jgi:dynein heavy chain, axonemal